MSDTGAADPRLSAALAAHLRRPSPAARAEVLAALAGARVFVPVHARHRPPDDDGRSTGSETLLLTLVGSAGGRALPLFLEIGQAVQFRPGARPVPLSGPEACRGALDDGAVAVLVDPPGAALAVSGAELRELAAGRVPVTGAPLSARRTAEPLRPPDASDPALLRALGEALRDEPVREARLLEGPDGLVLGVVLDAGASAAEPDPAVVVALARRVLPRVPGVELALTVVRPGGPGLPVSLPRPGLLARARRRAALRPDR